MNPLVCLLLTVLALCSSAQAVDLIPANRQVPASIVNIITTPANDAMHMPTDVAIDSRGRIYVADGANDRIVWFNADGRFAAAIGDVNGEKLLRPVGIFIDSKDQLWIADTGNHRILGVKATGSPEVVTPPPTDKGTACDPTDLVVSADGRRMYVVDNNAHRLLIRDNRTSTWTALGGYGRSLGQFQWPFMMCIGEDRYIYVSEAIGARVQRISPSDKWAGEIGRWGVNLGEFYRPKGLATDSKGRVYVGDSTMGVIQVFSARGRVEGVLTGKDGMPLRFEHPMGMCLDRNGKLYVVELKANRVAVVEIGK